MPYSSDPVKRRRQMAALAANNPAVARKLAENPAAYDPVETSPAPAPNSPIVASAPATGRSVPATPPPAPAATTTIGGVPVVEYQEPTHAPSPEPVGADLPDGATDDELAAEPEPESGPELAAEPEPRARRSGFLDGFLSG